MDNNTPLFSVLIANYNNGPYIRQAIESVCAQIYANWEIIIVDDSSEDDSVKIITTFLGNQKIKFYRNDRNYGCGFTKRKCVELACGAICGFLDPDDLLTSDAIQKMVEAHVSNENVSLVYSNFFSCNEDMGKKMEVKNKPLPLNMTYLEIAQPSIGHFASFKLLKYKEGHGINPELKRAVDQDLYYKLEEHGQLLHIDVPLYFYRLHKRGISLFNNFHKAFSWHIAVALDACRRRNIPFEEVVSKMIKHSYVDFYEQSKPFKVGTTLLWPFKKIKSFWSNYISIRG